MPLACTHTTAPTGQRATVLSQCSHSAPGLTQLACPAALADPLVGQACRTVRRTGLDIGAEPDDIAEAEIQGRRMKSARQKRQHIFIIPGGLLAAAPHADPGCSATT